MSNDLQLSEKTKKYINDQQVNYSKTAQYALLKVYILRFSHDSQI